MKYKKQHFRARIVSYILSFCMTFIMIPMTVHAQIVGKNNIPIKAIGQDMTIEVYFNNRKIGNESTIIFGDGKGYSRKGTNKIKIISTFDIGSVRVNNQEMVLSKGTTTQVEFKIKAAENYSIIVKKKKDMVKASKTMNNSNDNLLEDKATKIKTGNHNSDLIFMGVIGLSIL